MGIRETLGVGRNTKIKLVDIQRNRLDEEVEIITRNANNSNDLEMQSEQFGKFARIGLTGTSYLRSVQNHKNARMDLESAEQGIRLISDKSPNNDLKPVLSAFKSALSNMNDSIQRGNFIGVTSAVLTDKGNKQNKRKR